VTTPISEREASNHLALKMMEDSPAAWFCIRTHPKHEHIAAAHLRQIEGVEVFAPELRIERVLRGRRVRLTEPLFVSYIFARATLEKTLEKVRFTPAVKNVVHFGGRVATIPNSVIEELRTILVENADTVFTDTPIEGDEAAICTVRRREGRRDPRFARPPAS
jgi:transcriptional antiterminator RfaH